MSDETPDAHVDGAEPSMEDILASIRRIIADEDGLIAAEDSATPSEAAESFTIVDAGAENKIVDNALPAVTAGDSEADDTLSEMDLLLSELDGGDDEVLGGDLVEPSDGSEPDASPLSSLGAVAAASLGALASAGIATADSITGSRSNPKPEPMDTGAAQDLEGEALDLLLDSDDILTDFDADNELEALLQIPDSDEADSVDEIDALLEGLLFDDNAADKSVGEDDRVLDPAADMIDAYEAQSTDTVEIDDLPVEAESSDELTDELLAELLGEDVASDETFEDAIVDETALPETPQSTNDLNLVKSLMADLTAKPYDATQAEAEAQADSTDTAEVSDTEGDLVDEILSLSMNDETSVQDIDSKPPSEAFVIDINEDLASDKTPANSSAPSSLAEIAQVANADADSLQRRAGFGAAGFAAGAGVLITSINEDDSTESDKNAGALQEVQEILAEINHMQSDEGAVAALGRDESGEALALENETTMAEQTPQDTNLTQETAEMPKAAAKQDTIIDKVTEEATAGAFASLNQVVENQAVVADRGDRIGDLVTEALRPMLKEWLDKNLKGIVERAVTKEVKRISSGK